MICRYSAEEVKLTNYDFSSLGWKIAIGSLSTSALAALKLQPMTSLEHRLESSLDGTSGEISYVFSFVFYGSVEAITEAVHRWFYFLKYRRCLITAPVVLTTCLRAWYSSYAFTRSMHRPPLTRCCTNHLFTKH